MSAYYNEIEPFAAQWLRNLVSRNLIAPGEVDERSIADVRGDDLRGFTQCHFFAGIGIWSHALRLAGWPEEREVWTGSCPCQPFSAAGKGEGYADERHLWPHWHRLIRECRPQIIFGEQVGAAAAGFDCTNKSLPSLLGRETILRILCELEGESTGNLQGMHEWARAQIQTRSPRIDGRAVQQLEGQKARLCIGYGSAPSGEAKVAAMHTGFGGDSGANRPWVLRGHGDTVRSYQASLLECAFAGQDQSEGRLHTGEHEGSPLFLECDGERLGSPEGCRGGERNPRAAYKAQRRIQRTLDRCFEGEARDSWLDLIHDDLEREGYSVGSAIFPACSVGAPHIRQRLYFVAHADGGNASAERLQRGGEQRLLEKGCGSCELADDDRMGRRGRRASEAVSEPGEIERPERCGDAGDMGDTDDAGSQGRLGGIVRERAGEQPARSASASGFWSDAIYLPCRDGKARPTKPGLFPLAHGYPGRVGILRAAGNAIVAPQAAEFIAAAMECMP